MPNARAADDLDFPVERTAHYRSLLQLGHGGMARVYLAVRIGAAGFRRLCVLKRMQDHLLQNEEFQRMFLREARLAARLNHPNIVSTEEVGHDADGHFMAMEYLEGESYLALLNKVKREKLDFSISVRVLIEVLRGLEYAHGMKDFDGTPMQIVHRDLSPGNIFITYDGRIKVLDFGIAKVLDSRGETQTGVLKGKLSYMSPEQVRGQPVSIQTDLYAIGVLLWEAAAGRRRWENLPEAAVLRYLISGKAPEGPGAVQRGLPAEVDAICIKALAIDPTERFTNAREFRQVLESLLDQLGRNPGAEAVGQAVAQHFQEERDRLRSEIESLLKRIQIEESISISWQSQQVIERQVAELEQYGSSRTRRLNESAVKPISDIRSPEATQSQAARPKGRAALIGGLAALFAAAGLVVWQRQEARAPVAEAAHPQAPTSTPSPAAAPVGAKFGVSASPATAILFVNGNRLPSNPYQIEIPASGKLEIRVEAPGYITETQSVSAIPGGSVAFRLLPDNNGEEAIERAPTAASGVRNVGTRAYRTERAAAPVGATRATTAAEPVPAPAAAPAPTAPSEPAPEPARRTKKAGVSLDSEDPWK